MNKCFGIVCMCLCVWEYHCLFLLYCTRAYRSSGVFQYFIESNYRLFHTHYSWFIFSCRKSFPFTSTFCHVLVYTSRSILSLPSPRSIFLLSLPLLTLTVNRFLIFASCTQAFFYSYVYNSFKITHNKKNTKRNEFFIFRYSIFVIYWDDMILKLKCAILFTQLHSIPFHTYIHITRSLSLPRSRFKQNKTTTTTAERKKNKRTIVRCMKITSHCTCQSIKFS